MDAAFDSEGLYNLLDTVKIDDVETARRVGQQVRQNETTYEQMLPGQRKIFVLPGLENGTDYVAASA